MSFAAPVYGTIAVIALVVIAVAFAVDMTRRRAQLDKMGHAPQLARMMPRLSGERRVLKAVLVSAGIALAVGSLARPQVEGETLWRRRALDVVIVVDASLSMLARDTYPSRFESASRTAQALARELAGERIAVVVYAGDTLQFPLTHDGEAALSLLRGLSPTHMPGGSELGTALLVARCIVRPDVRDAACGRLGGRGRGGAPLSDADDFDLQPLTTGPDNVQLARAIVVLTDGEDTSGRARAEVERTTSLGIELFFVGIGTPEGELIPEYDAAGNEIGWKKQPDGKSFVTTRLEREALEQLAGMAGEGSRLISGDDRSVSALVVALERLKTGDLDQRVIKTRVDVFERLLFPAWLILLIEACLSERRRLRARGEAAR